MRNQQPHPPGKMILKGISGGTSVSWAARSAVGLGRGRLLCAGARRLCGVGGPQ